MLANGSSPLELLNFESGLARVSGPYGSGKTSAILARCRRLAQRHQQSLIVVAPSALRAVRDEIWAAAPLGDARIEAHSWKSLAEELVASDLGSPRFRTLSADAEIAILASLTGLDPESSHLARLGRARERLIEPTSNATGPGEPTELDDKIEDGIEDLANAFAQHCRKHGLVDAATLLAMATSAAKGQGVLWCDSYAHVVFDDLECLSQREHRLAQALTQRVLSKDGSVVVATNPDAARWGAPLHHGPLHSEHSYSLDVQLPKRQSSADLGEDFEVIEIRHRSLRGSAIVAEIQRLVGEGLRHDDIVVIVPATRAGRDTANAVRDAANRCAIPTTWPTLVGDYPLARAIADQVQAQVHAQAHAQDGVLGTQARPSEVVLQHWERQGKAHLPIDPDDRPSTPVRTRSFAHLGAIRALHQGVVAAEQLGLRGSAVFDFARRSRVDDTHQDSDSLGRVAIVFDESTRGRRWPVALVTGFEEGNRPVSVADDHRDDQAGHLTEQRRRVEHALSRATRQAIACTSVEPGVLRSRFLEGRSTRPSELHRHRNSGGPTLVAPTNSDSGFWSGRQLRASASSLETFRNCPLEYTYKYVFGIQTESGAQATVGTITHDVLEAFFDPSETASTTSPQLRMQTLFEQRWDDNEFAYLAQAAEYRATVWTMLENVVNQIAIEKVDVLRVEYPFAVEIGPYQVSGKIDRVDRLPVLGSGSETGSSSLRIIDYKTGNWTNDRVGEESLQLGVYFLAAKRDPELAALGTPTQLALQFLKVGREAHQVVGAHTESRWQKVVVETMDQIATGDHAPSPLASCEYCAFSRVCPTQPDGRVVLPSNVGRDK